MFCLDLRSNSEYSCTALSALFLETGRSAFTRRSELSIIQAILIQALPDLWYRQNVTCALALSTTFFPCQYHFPFTPYFYQKTSRQCVGNFKAVLLRSFRSEGRRSTFKGLKPV
jgi:hypothetical protein